MGSYLETNFGNKFCCRIKYVQSVLYSGIKLYTNQPYKKTVRTRYFQYFFVGFVFSVSVRNPLRTATARNVCIEGRVVTFVFLSESIMIVDLLNESKTSFRICETTPVDLTTLVSG